MYARPFTSPSLKEHRRGTKGRGVNNHMDYRRRAVRKGGEAAVVWVKMVCSLGHKHKHIGVDVHLSVWRRKNFTSWAKERNRVKL